ncbi:nuclear transport factor 2 family protein [Micromonospora tarensis]|uniref:Nuclear transport factor 2 family protein n=1 Tax=Micromonospora tarensis TaxID=2806100 RepID=A0ABS1YF07_9ACTN|nr:nuclear transport factor 2 family protein [Micromonospora tarensis]MBM0276004.1 nuclear transport factor 2 family protein [Micromonospora tarensis]
MALFHLFVRTAVVPFLYHQVSAGRYWVVLAICTRDVRNSAAGDSALGGARTGRVDYRRWFDRMFRLTRSIRPRADSVRVEGSPRRATVTVHWTDHVYAHDGRLFVNRGIHRLRLSWGFISEVHQDWDEDMVRDACRHAADLGYREALAPPIAH